MTAIATRTGPDIAPRPISYLAASLLVVAGGYGVAIRFGADPTGAAVALLAAWAIQAVAFGLLAPRLRDGRDATNAWAVGIGLRVGSLLAAWPLTAFGPVGREEAVAFGLCLAALMILEAIWLAVLSATTGSTNR
ncbi:MAG: hypothetical protein ACODAA_08605 [Gemmatimonadota bacterium]